MMAMLGYHPPVPMEEDQEEEYEDAEEGGDGEEEGQGEDVGGGNANVGDFDEDGNGNDHDHDDELGDAAARLYDDRMRGVYDFKDDDDIYDYNPGKEHDEEDDLDDEDEDETFDPSTDLRRKGKGRVLSSSSRRGSQTRQKQPQQKQKQSSSSKIAKTAGGTADFDEYDELDQVNDALDERYGFRDGNEDDEEDEDDEEEEEGDEEEDAEGEAGVNVDKIPEDIERLLEEAVGSVSGTEISTATTKSRAQRLLLFDDDEGEDDELPDLADTDGFGFVEPGMPGWGGDEGYAVAGMGNKRAKKKKSKQKGQQKDHNRSPEVIALMGKANLAYANQDSAETFRLLHEVIRADFKAADAWRLLAVMHDENGDPKKALQANFVAAHLTPKDGALWIRLAGISMTLNNVADAIYCYSKAISADSTDVEAWFERSLIYSGLRFYQKAIDGFSTVLRYSPNNMKAVQELSRIYLLLKEIPKAISLYESALAADRTQRVLEEQERRAKGLDTNIKGKQPLMITSGGSTSSTTKPFDAMAMGVYEEEGDDEEDEEVIGIIGKDGSIRPAKEVSKGALNVGFEELYNLCELYGEVREFEKAAVAIQNVTLRLCGWSEEDIEGSFRDLRWELDEGVVGVMPVELRVRLGVCRLWVDDAESAKNHFEALFKYTVEDYPELYVEVASAYREKRMFALAVGIYEMLIKFEQTNIPSTWAGMADCFQQLGNFESAVELYLAAIDVETENTDWKLQLAEVYEALGEEEKAKNLLEEVNHISKTENEKAMLIQPRARRSRAVASITTSPAQQPRRRGKGGSRGRGKRGAGNEEDSERIGAMLVPGSEVSLRRRITEDKAIAIAEERLRIRENHELWERMKTLMDRLHEYVRRVDFLRTARQLIIRFQNHRLFYPYKTYVAPKRKPGTENEPNDEPDTFEGLTFDQWYEAFSTYALALTMDGKDEDAYSALKSAFDANVFYHNEKRKINIRLQMIASAICCGNFGRAVDHIRWLTAYRPHDNDMYRLYCAVLQGGSEAISAFASSISQKYFLRQVRALDKMAGKGGAGIGKSPVLLNMYGHILMCARSYTNALMIFAEAVKLSPDDPLINLSIGLGYLHWAMQRRTEKRHWRIAQAFTFLFRYSELRNNDQEACYNIARSFHQIGLKHIAVEYYQKVLDKKVEDPSMDLSREAAYNLSLIYVESGSMGLAQYTLRKYIVI
ncbi:transcription factor TFIIIC subunit tfc4 [Blyttiomyces sp. JEL0837]|nr:transcription factor TFIIIC subunit tfc4 [Blyttiomyces sp. JEL0837]